MTTQIKRHMDAIFSELRDQHALGRINHRKLFDEILPAYQDLEFELQANRLIGEHQESTHGTA